MEDFNKYFWHSVSRIVERKYPDYCYYPSTFVDLDKVIEGFRPGELIIVSGVPGIGKTSLVLNILYRMASKDSCPVGYITTETGIENIYDSLVQIATDKSITELRSLKSHDIEQLFKTKPDFEKTPLLVESMPQTFDYSGSYEGIKNKIKQWDQDGEVACICLDSLQYLTLIDRSRLTPKESDIHYIVHDLKRLALELSTPIILVSEMQDPMFQGFSDSQYHNCWMLQYGDDGACSEVADVFIQVERPEYYSIYEDERGNDLRGVIKLNVQKNRFGEAGQVKLQIKGCRVSEVGLAPDYASTRFSFCDDTKENHNII